MNRETLPRSHALLPMALLVAAVVLQATRAPWNRTLLSQLWNDSAMRLVQVRDLLGGQGWFDLMQYRLGPEGGFEMHWSRLVDAPIAGLILALEPILGRAGAEIATLVLWPALLLAAALYATLLLCRSLGGASAATLGVVIAALNFVFFRKFGPGHLDHHNVQVVLLLLGLLGLVRRHEHAAYPWLAGAAVALSVAIGTEFLPLMALLALGAAGFWAVAGARERRPVILFALSVIVVLGAAFAGSAPPSAWSGGYCDSLSADLALPVMLGCGAIAFAAAAASDRSAALRTGLLAVLFAGVVAATVMFWPACLSNPLDALDPYLKENWLSRVSEAKGLSETWARDRGFFLALCAPGAVGLTLALAALHRAERRMEWALVALLTAAALGFTAYQLRGVTAVTALATLPIAVTAARLLTGPRPARRRRLAALGAILLLVASMSVVWSVWTDRIGKAIARQEPENESAGEEDDLFDTASCYSEEAMAPLAALPRGLVSGGSNLGAKILLRTQHRVLSAPYHRNQSGMIAQLRIALSETDDEARELLLAQGADYLVICTGNPDYTVPDAQGPDDARFLYRVVAGYRPDFLEPVDGVAEESPLKVFHIR